MCRILEGKDAYAKRAINFQEYKTQPKIRNLSKQDDVCIGRKEKDR